MQAASEADLRDDLAQRQWDDVDGLDAAIERALSEVETPVVRLTLPEEASFRCIVNYRGAYAYWDLPTGELDQSRDFELVEDHTEQEGIPRSSTARTISPSPMFGPNPSAEARIQPHKC